MYNAIKTSVSGLMAATQKAKVAASNIANAQVVSSPQSSVGNLADARGYIPQRVEQTTNKNGGVKSTILPVNPASLSLYDPSSPLSSQEGFVHIPNVSLAAESAELIRASQSYKANAKVLKILDESQKSLLDALK